MFIISLNIPVLHSYSQLGPKRKSKEETCRVGDQCIRVKYSGLATGGLTFKVLYETTGSISGLVQPDNPVKAGVGMAEYECCQIPDLPNEKYFFRLVPVVQYWASKLHLVNSGGFGTAKKFD